MSISRVKPNNWSYKDVPTSAELNQLDINTAKGLDKTVAGDTLSGEIQVASTGSIIFGTGSELILGNASEFKTDGDVTADCDFDAASEIKNDGYSYFNELAVGTLNVGPGTHYITGNVYATAGASSYTSTHPVAINSLWVGNKLTYSTRGIARVEWQAPLFDLSHEMPVSATQRFLYVNVSTTSFIWQPLDMPHNSELTTLAIYFNGATVSRAALPSVMPRFRVYKMHKDTGTSYTVSSDTVDPSVSVAAYEAYHSINIGGMSEIVDKETFLYYLRIVPESGTNSQNLAKYFCCKWYVNVTEQDEA